MRNRGRTEMLSTVPCSKCRGASYLKNRKKVKCQTAVYMPKIGRTEMLSTVPCSKFRGASFKPYMNQIKTNFDEKSHGALTCGPPP